MDKKEFEKLPIGTVLKATTKRPDVCIEFNARFIVFENLKKEKVVITNEAPCQYFNESSTKGLLWKEYEFGELKNVRIAD